MNLMYCQYDKHKVVSSVFSQGNSDVKYAAHSALLTDKVDAISEKVEHDRHICSDSYEMGIDHKATTVMKDMKKSGYTKKFAIYILYELTERKRLNECTHLRFSICTK